MSFGPVCCAEIHTLRLTVTGHALGAATRRAYGTVALPSCQDSKALHRFVKNFPLRSLFTLVTRFFCDCFVHCTSHALVYCEYPGFQLQVTGYCTINSCFLYGSIDLI
jgi:hypothetical protein